VRVQLIDFRQPVEAPEQELHSEIARRLRLKPGQIASWRILRKSLDARDRDALQFVYTLAVDLACTPRRLRSTGGIQVRAWHPQPFYNPPAGARPLEHPPVVVGSGPAGLLAAYYLAWRGYRPLILERGHPVKERVQAIRAFDAGAPHDPENNYLFGEGGAGTFSDGKLTCRMTGPDVEWVLQQFVRCGGRPSLVYEHRPHLGSNRLPMLVRNFRRQIEAWGGRYRFGCRLEGLDIAHGRLRGLHTSSGYIAASHVVLGIGHSARDTYEMLLASGVPMRPKAFQLGLRIEQPQEQINQHAYGRPEYEQLLGAADYSLVAHGQRDVFTFCMCAGGYVIPSVSEPGMFCTNGMSNSRHDSPFANSGIVATLAESELPGNHPLAGVELQRQYEAIAYQLGGGQYLAPIQWAVDFLAGRKTTDARLPSSYRRGTTVADLHAVLPPCLLRVLAEGMPALDHKFGGALLSGATLVGPEMRGSSPVRMDRSPATRQTPGIAGLFPVGEGAGYAGGIVSAAVDGLRSARLIVETCAPLEEMGARPELQAAEVTATPEDD
jgi:hypothetical protein